MTTKQKALAEAIVENEKLPRAKRKNKKKLLVSVGYSAKTANRHPKRTIKQKGTKEALKELGFDFDTMKMVNLEAVLNKEASWSDRLKAVDMAYKVLGSYKLDPDANKDRGPDPALESINRLIKMLVAEHKQKV